MLKRMSFFIATLLFVSIALWSAQNKVAHFDQLKSLRVGQTVDDLDFLGPAISEDERERVYLLPNSSSLIVSIFDNKVVGAWLTLKTPVKIEDGGEWGELEFVQVNLKEENPAWFFAGSPKDGRVFKVNQLGFIEAITWIKPFSSIYPQKKLQALYREFSVNQQKEM